MMGPGLVFGTQRLHGLGWGSAGPCCDASAVTVTCREQTGRVEKVPTPAESMRSREMEPFVIFPLVFFKIVLLFFFNVNKMKTLAGKMPAGL